MTQSSVFVTSISENKDGLRFAIAIHNPKK